MALQTAGVETTVYIGNIFEYVITGTQIITTQYYYAGSQRVAMRDASGVQYLLTDHLGSLVVVLDANGALLSEQRYLPFGGVRTDVVGINQTDFGYTGQRGLSAVGLMDYNARLYDPVLMRFTQTDTIVPGVGNVLAYDRYGYVFNNPLRYTDPSGHICSDMSGGSSICSADDDWSIVLPEKTREYYAPPSLKTVVHNLVDENYELEILTPESDYFAPLQFTNAADANINDQYYYSEYLANFSEKTFS